MNISALINSFLEQHIQSEAEVRSKLIVPLLELLGYPIDLRAEEFPVYGFEGGKPLSAKAADFLQFSSKEFDTHRGKSDTELEWVYNHSLLVFEAKKPTEEILVKGQPVFYSAWTKSVAYIISNGKKIEGYIVNANYSDTCVFSCLVSEIPGKWELINKLNYDNILALKSTSEYKAKWTHTGTYESYKNIMRVRCTEELYASVDRTLEKVSYTPHIIKNREVQNYNDVLDETSKIITSEPGGGKSYLLHMLLRDYLSKYDETDEKIPIILEGRYYGKIYNSINEGIYKELNIIIPHVTSEIIEKRLHSGGFIILFDALDEVEINYDSLLHELHQLRRDTNCTIIVTSRLQNYKDDLCTDFIHYSLEPLSDSMVSDLLNKYSKEEIPFNIHCIPQRLLEVIKTPLFLKLFVTISEKNGTYRIPTNHATLFEMYIAEKTKALSCSLFEENIVKKILSKYAIYSYEHGDNTDKFFEILDEFCEPNNKTKIYDIIWKSGIICNGLQGIKYFHKTMHEFFVALYISKLELSDIKKWLSESICQEKYYEVVCYLTGIISNHHQQNMVLDYLEMNNLKLYLRALKSRKNFACDEQELSNQYATEYFGQLLKTYKNIIETHFKNIRSCFDGFNKDGTGKVCIKGNINFSAGSVSMVIYTGTFEENELEVEISSKEGPMIISPNGTSSPIYSSVFTQGNINQRYYNLELLSYGFDSSREIAIDIIKEQIKKALDDKLLFDIDIDVLLVEKTENLLKKFRNSHWKTCDKNKLSLYNNNAVDIISYLEATNVKSKEKELITVLCRVLDNKGIVLADYLDIQPDIEYPKSGGFLVDSVYSDNQIVEKIKKINYLTAYAVNDIVYNYIPVLLSVYINTQTIGSVYRKGGNSGFDYIEVKTDNKTVEKPIIEFNEKETSPFPELNEYYLTNLKKICKSKNDVISRGGTIIYAYFGDDVFHDFIYKEIKDLFSRLFGQL